MSVDTCKSSFALYIAEELPEAIPAPEFSENGPAVFHKRKRLHVSADPPEKIYHLFLFTHL